MTYDFKEFSDEQLAEYINSAVAELKERHTSQKKELAKRHAQQLSGALADKARKRGRKPREIASAA